MTYASYERCYSCSGKAQPGTVALLKYLLLKFPYARSMGIYNCRNVAGTSTKSIHSCGRALDLGIPTLSNGRANTTLGHPVVRFLDEYSTQLGIHGQIYDRVRYDRSNPRGRYYGGAHPHYDHNHIEQTLAKATTLTYADIVEMAGDPVAGGGEEMLYGLDIGKPGENSKPDAPAHRVLQAFLVRQGQDIGAWGDNKDGVDGKPGDDTRKGLHNWKIANGITSATSAGDGKIGDYEMAAIYASGGAGGAAPDLSDYAKKSDLTKYATDADLANHAKNPDAHHA